MKKALILAAVLFTIGLKNSFAQTVTNPDIESTDSPTSTITKIETDQQYTVVSFRHYAGSDNAWAVLNREIYIQTDVDNKHYGYVKSEGIAVAPETRNTLKKLNDKLEFKVYFKKIPANAKTIDIIERAGKRSDGINYFNFYNVDVTHSSPGDKGIKITNVELLPPPPVNGTEQPSSDGANGMANAMGAMGPMYASMAKSLLDAQFAYFKQPGKIAEIAKLNKEYFDALTKEGFTNDQALKIITANSIIPKSASINGQ
ncbi:hypothetical protein [Mucilaginibacter ginsenosidivorax]|uniref:SH3 domain-containing protein n=1 Tax=Mucilaginibacter ginsenosidivorax TaxID=862126 RepID=A0A5B8W6J5_9SPHI|nr:hypothetical protein [Mucilaginibacter ginsenosidivorax]QEC79630.1 hypothetical protein FSB76_28105 [Mucilaginibacter ginsenosidivorax]